MNNINENIPDQITPQILKYADRCINNSCIDESLYNLYDVKRGLRDKNGKGVLSGITNISLIKLFLVKENFFTVE